MTVNAGLVNGVTRPPIPVAVKGDQPRIEPASGTWFLPRFANSNLFVSQTAMGVQGFTVLNNCVIDQFRCSCTTAAAGTAIMALYDSDSTASPRTLIWQGTVDTTTTGQKSVVSNASLTAGTYWVGIMGGTAAAQFQGDNFTTSSPNSAAPRSTGTADNLSRTGAYVFTGAATGTPPSTPRWSIAIFTAGVANVEMRFA